MPIRVWRSRRSSALIVLLLAVGIGLSTATWSVLDGVLLRGLPFPEGDRIVTIASHGGYDRPMPVPDFEALRDHGRVFTDVGAFVSLNSVLTQPAAGSKGMTAAYVTGNLWELLRVQPLFGRGFVPADEHPTAPSVAILSHGVWQTRFGGDRDVIGKPVILNRETMTIIGVMPEGFAFPIRQEAWTNFRRSSHPFHIGSMFVVGRLPDGSNAAAAARALEPLGRALDASSPLDSPRRFEVRPYTAAVVPAAVQRALRVLLLLVLGVLLFACANAAGLQLGEALARERELAVRRALGASSAGLTRLLLGESVVLVIAGTAAGLGLALALVAAASRWLLDGSPLLQQFWIDVRLDHRAFLFAALTASLAILIAGLFPALLQTLARESVAAVFGSGRRTTVSRGALRVALVLLTIQIAVCFVLVLSAGLTAHSGLALLRERPAFDTRDLTRILLNGFQADLKDAESARQLWARLSTVIRNEPGIVEATLANSVPWWPQGWFTRVRIGVAAQPTADSSARVVRVLPEFFDLMRLPILAGRALVDPDITDTRSPPSHLPAIVSAGFASRHFGRDPVGRRFTIEADQVLAQPLAAEVVGVAADLGLDSRSREEAIYLPFVFDHGTGGFMLVRGPGGPATIAAAVDRAIARVNPLVATLEEQSFAQDQSQQSWVNRRLAQLLVLFGATALWLAGVGLYGTVVLALRLRRAELAIRSALGARPDQLAKQVVRATALAWACGISFGLLCATNLRPWLERLLYQTDFWELQVLIGAIVALAIVALAAASGPALAAARMDPAAVLSDDA